MRENYLTCNFEIEWVSSLFYLHISYFISTAFFQLSLGVLKKIQYSGSNVIMSVLK